MIKNIGIIISIILFSSCMKDEYIMSNLDGSQISPSVGIPIVSSAVNMSQMVINPHESEFLNVDDDSLIHIYFRQELANIKLSDIGLDLGDQTITQSNTIDPISLDRIDISNSIALSSVVESMSEPDKSNLTNSDGQNILFPAFNINLNSNSALDPIDDFDDVNFAAGQMQLSITNDWPFDMENLTIDILNNDDQSIVASYTFTLVEANTSYSQEVDLTGKRMDNELVVRFGSIESPGTSDLVLLNLASQLTMDFRALNLLVGSGNIVFPEIQIVDDTIRTEITVSNQERLRKLELIGGSLDYDFDYQLMEKCQVQIFIPQARKIGEGIFNLIIELDPDNPSSFQGSASFEGYTFTFDVDEPNEVISVIRVSTISSGTPKYFSTDQEINAEIGLVDFQVNFVQGYLGTQTIYFESDPIDFALGTENLPGNLELAEPSIDLIFINGFGLPFSVDLANLSAESSDGTTLNFTGSAITNPTLIGAPKLSSQIGDSVTSVLSLNDSTSNIVEILNNDPSKITPYVMITTNPVSETDSNFVTYDGFLKTYLDIDIPLYASLSDFNLKDTIDFSLGNFAIDLQKPSYMMANFENSFPIELIAQLYFADESYNIIDSFIVGDNLIAAATLDETGFPVSNGISQLKIPLEGSKLQNIGSATKIIIDVIAQSPEDGSTAGKFLTTSKLQFNIGLVATMKFF